MKTNFRLLWCGALLACTPVFAVAADGFLEKLFPPLPKTGDNQVSGMIFASAISGTVECRSERITNMIKGDKVLGRGATIRTFPGATATLVFSNGISIFVQEKTELRVEKFDQEPFSPNNNLLIEPSNSQLIVYVPFGQFVISTPQLLSGTRIVFETPHAACYILNNQSGGEKAFLEVTDNQTHFAMITGLARVKVRAPDGTLESIGSTLKPAQQAFVRYTMNGDNKGGTGMTVDSGGNVPAPSDAASAASPPFRLPEGVTVGVDQFYVGKLSGTVKRIVKGTTIDLKQGEILEARGNIIKTGSGAKATLLFANGTSFSLGDKVEFKVDKFDQEAFTPNNVLGIEPSNSQTVVILRTGRMEVDTPQLLSGSSLIIESAHGAVSILNNQPGGQKISFNATAKSTLVDMARGKASIRPRQPDGAFVSLGTVVQAGDQAVVKPTLGADPKLDENFALIREKGSSIVEAGEFMVTSASGPIECTANGTTVPLHAGDFKAAPGASIKAGDGARATILFANQTSLALGEKTALTIEKFQQEPFSSSGAVGVEPSSSQTLIQLQSGQIAIDTPQLLAGSSLVFETPHSAITIPGGQSGGQQATIEVTEKNTQCSVISGQASVKPRGADGRFLSSGTVLHPGQLAVVKPVIGAAGPKNATGASLTSVAIAPAPIVPAGAVVTTAPTEALVLRMYGPASYQLSEQGEKADLSPGSRLPEGAIIETGDDSQVYLMPYPGAIATIQPGSRVVIERLAVTTAAGVVVKREIIFDLKNGSLLSMIDPAQHAINRYAIRTPKGLAQAQGTAFSVTVADNAMSVTATADTVTFTTASGEVYSIAAGNVTVTPPGGEPGAPIPISQAVAANPAFSSVVRTAMTTVSNIVQNDIGNLSAKSSANLISQVVAVASAAIPSQATAFTSQAVTAVTATTSSTAGNSNAAAAAVTAAAAVGAPSQVPEIAAAAAQAAPSSAAASVAAAAAQTDPRQAVAIAVAVMQSYSQANPQAGTRAYEQAAYSLAAAVASAAPSQAGAVATALIDTGSRAASTQTNFTQFAAGVDAAAAAATGGPAGNSGPPPTSVTVAQSTGGAGGFTGAATGSNIGGTGRNTTASSGTTNPSQPIGALQSTSVIITQANGGSTTQGNAITGGTQQSTSIIVTQLNGGQINQISSAVDVATNAQSTVTFGTTGTGTNASNVGSTGGTGTTGGNPTVTVTPTLPTVLPPNSVVSPAEI